MRPVIAKSQNFLKNKKLEEDWINWNIFWVLLWNGSNLTEPSFHDVKKEIKVQTIYETMFSYCLKCRKNTGSKNLNVVKSKIGRIMLLSKCAVSNSEKTKLFKEQEDKGWLGNLQGAKIF